MKLYGCIWEIDVCFLLFDVHTNLFVGSGLATC
jgi:hypothetical protein